MFKIDWNNQQIINKVPIVLRGKHTFWGGRGGHRGGRGIYAFEGYLYVATVNTIQVYDFDLNFIREILNPKLAGLHEIYIEPNGIWCTSTIHDLIIKIDFEGKSIYEWYGHESELMKREFGLKERIVDFEFDRENLDTDIVDKIDSYVSTEQLHANTVCVQKDNIYVFCNKINSLIKIYPKPEKVILVDLSLNKSAHNCISHNDHMIILNDTSNQNIKLYNIDGQFLKKIKTDQNKIFSFRNKSIQFSKPGWQRGLSRIEEDVYLVGTSPASIFEVNIETSKVGQKLIIDKDIRHCIHGLHVI